ncbi:MAG: hypothetical protein R3C26_05205 [Calditrichia bacterium]
MLDFRKTQDIVTPIGELANTKIQTTNASAGIGLVKNGGTIGTSASHYQSDYGIHDQFAGHPGGVNRSGTQPHQTNGFQSNSHSYAIELAPLFARLSTF